MVDARPKARFEGTAPEPNPRLNSGSILGTTNIPFTMMVNPDTLTLKDNAALEKGRKDLCEEQNAASFSFFQ